MKVITSLLFICFFLSISGCVNAPPADPNKNSGFSPVPYSAYFTVSLGTRVYDQWSKAGVTFSDILDTNYIAQLNHHFVGIARIRLIVDYNNSRIILASA